MCCPFPRSAAIVALSIAFAPLLHAQQDSSDARVVIYVDSLDRAAFSNIAELLQARVPGLHIARTGDGGLRWFMRGPASVAESHPMVLVDDVRINVAGSERPEMGTRPPLLDEIDIEDVERIEIWSGAATSSRHGTGAGNGVIRIVTARPRAGPTSFRITVVASALEENVDYPANFNRPGVDTTGRVVRCTLQGEANDYCTPTSPLTSINVLESNSPFERAFGGRVAASLSSGDEQLAWRGAATLDRQGSTDGNLAYQRLHVRGAAAFRPHATANVGVNAFWTRGDGDLPPNNPALRLLRQGLFARADAAWPGFVEPNIPIYNSLRLGGGVKGRWRPRGWLDARITSGLVRAADEDDLQYEIGGTLNPRQVDERGERRRRDWNARLNTEAGYGTGSIRHATELIVEHAVAKHEEEHSTVVTIPGSGTAHTSFWLTRRLAIAGVGLEQRMRLGERATLVGGARLDQVRVNDVRWDVPVARYASLLWDGPPFGAHAWGRVRFRAALGDVATVPQTVQGLFFIAGEPERPKAEFTRERELGFDATVLGDRLGLSLTWYTKRTANVGNMTFRGQFLGFQRIEVLNRGVAGTVHGRIIQTSGFTWDARAWYAYNHNEVTRGSRALLVTGFDPFNQSTSFIRQWIGEGLPLGAHRSQPIISLQDLDQDGRADNACYEFAAPCEVVVSQSEDFHPGYPPRSLSVATSVRFRAFTFRALLDRRAGHFINNHTMEARCLRECQARYDPSTSFREQAEVILSGNAGIITAQDASYTKLREISVHMAAPLAWAKALGASRLGVSLAGRNVATWTDYRGLDPETTSLHWIPLANEDNVAEPLPRRFSIRLTATK